MHPNKIDNLLNLNPQERLEYFIRQSVQNKVVWTLETEQGYLIFKDVQGDEIFPVWAESEIAEICMFEEHREMGAIPVSIKINSFIHDCIPDMVEENVLFGVFYDKNREAICIKGAELQEELISECEEIWGE